MPRLSKDGGRTQVHLESGKINKVMMVICFTCRATGISIEEKMLDFEKSMYEEGWGQVKDIWYCPHCLEEMA